ncbi:MAG: hypothetical protein H6737_23820 [Alphaproteobacteria bacterium]|nr:hypothetical protein [Alphaproteobacteria bacterium]
MLFLLAACTTTPSLAPHAEGSLTIVQLDLRGAPGEAALVVGPDGTSALIDVGAPRHVDTVRGALDAFGIDQPDHVLLTHDDRDHVGGFEGYTAQPVRWDTAELPVALDLGGPVLTVFLADGRLATSSGVETLPVDLEGEDNARSLAGVVTWGTFEYVFAGDLTGGGKGTPDVEGAVAARAADIPWIPAGGVDAMHVNHHGISSSTSAAWATWLRPDHAIVGANGFYLDAPSEECLAALPAHTRVWVTEDGSLGNTDARTTVKHGDVVLTVDAAGGVQVEH